MKRHSSLNQQTVIASLNPKIRGWGGYYRHGASKRGFAFVDCQIWKSLRLWCFRKHSSGKTKPKGKRWIANKYYMTLNGRQLRFATKTLTKQGEAKILALFELSKISIERHIKVKGTASPDDPSLRAYWKQRNTRIGKTYWSYGSKYRKVAENQDWKCPVCNEHLFNGEELHTHHVIAVAGGGTDSIDNLVHLHQTCHQHIHSAKKKVLVSKRLEPLNGTTITSGS